MPIIPSTPISLVSAGVEATLTNQVHQQTVSVMNHATVLQREQVAATTTVSDALQSGALTPAHLQDIETSIAGLRTTIMQQAIAGFNLPENIGPDVITVGISSQVDAIIAQTDPSGTIQGLAQNITNVEGHIPSMVSDLSAPANVLKGFSGVIPPLDIKKSLPSFTVPAFPPVAAPLAAFLAAGTALKTSIEKRGVIAVGVQLSVPANIAGSVGNLLSSAMSSVNLSSLTGLCDISSITDNITAPISGATKTLLDSAIRGIADVQKIATHVTDLVSMGGRGIVNLVGNTPNVSTNAILDVSPQKLIAPDAETTLTNSGQTLQEIIDLT